MKLTKKEAAQLKVYAEALENQDKMSEIQFQKAFGVSKVDAKNNIAFCIKNFIEKHS